MQGGGQAAGDLQAPHPATDAPLGRAQHGEVVERLRPYMLGWKAYFGMAQTPKVWRSWTNGCATDCGRSSSSIGSAERRSTGNAKGLGRADVARQVAANCHRWWRNSGCCSTRVLTIAYFDRLGVPRLS